jgi:hypothetical protein
VVHARRDRGVSSWVQKREDGRQCGADQHYAMCVESTPSMNLMRPWCKRTEPFMLVQKIEARILVRVRVVGLVEWGVLAFGSVNGRRNHDDDDCAEHADDRGVVCIRGLQLEQEQGHGRKEGAVPSDRSHRRVVKCFRNVTLTSETNAGNENTSPSRTPGGAGRSRQSPGWRKSQSRHCQLPWSVDTLLLQL